MRKIILLIYILISPLYSGFAQSFLSVDDALKIALENNFNIMLSKNEALIDKTNNTLGNSGFLPNVGLNGSDNYAVNNINQLQTTKSGSPLDIIRKGATSKSLNANVALNWTLFDGGKMFVTKSKLSEIEAQGELQTRGQVQQTITDVIGAYYDVVKQKQQLLSYNQAITYNTERVKILQTTSDNGLAPKNLLLQAQLDLNVYQETAIRKANIIAASKRALNLLLSRNPDTKFDVSDTIYSDFSPNREELLKRLLANNYDLLVLEKSQKINHLTVKEIQSTRLPKINLNSSYNYSKVENSAGNLLRNNSNGLLVGASVAFPLFQGGNISRQIKVAKLQYQSGLISLEEARLQLTARLLNALDEYETESKLLQIEKKNETIARENLKIAIERLCFGQSTSLEVRQAEESFVESQTRRINFCYNQKLAEITIKQLVAQF